MKTPFILALLLSPVIYVSCTMVGNSPEEKKHRQWLQTQDEMFQRQLYRRTHAAVEDTEVYFYFTNELARRDRETLDLAWLGKRFVEDYGSNITWLVVTAAWTNFSQATPQDQVTNVIWLASQGPRTRDTAWLLNFRTEWMPQ
jgi:hypothetical protein